MPNLKNIIKKNPPRKNFLYFKKRNFQAPILKNVLCFWKWDFLALYFFYISGSNFLSSKNKKPVLNNFLNFGKWNFLAPSLKNFLYFRREFEKSENQKFHIFYLMREIFLNMSAKEKKQNQNIFL